MLDSIAQQGWNRLILCTFLFWNLSESNNFFFTVYPTINNAYPLAELRSLAKIRGDIDAVELVAELLSELSEINGHLWVSEIWIKSGLNWNNFLDDQNKIDEIIKNYVRKNP